MVTEMFGVVGTGNFNCVFCHAVDDFRQLELGLIAAYEDNVRHFSQFFRTQLRITTDDYYLD